MWPTRPCGMSAFRWCGSYLSPSSQATYAAVCHCTLTYTVTTFAMSLLKLDKDTITSDSDSTTSIGKHSLRHRTVYGAAASNNGSSASIYTYSTTSTMSNNIGAGRTIDKAFRKGGKRLEKMLGNLAHKLGKGPEATYQRICDLYLNDWRKNSEKGTTSSALQPALSLINFTPLQLSNFRNCASIYQSMRQSTSVSVRLNACQFFSSYIGLLSEPSLRQLNYGEI